MVLDVGSTRIPAFALLQIKRKRTAARLTPAVLIGTIPDSEIERAQELGVKAAVSSVSEALVEVERLMNGL